MAKASKWTPQKSWSELLTPTALAEYGQLTDAAPTDAFDPDGAWTQRWRIYVLRKHTWELDFQGHIEITRTPENGRARLAIRQSNFQGPQQSRVDPKTDPEGRRHRLLRTICDTRADVLCRADELLTPEAWTVQTAMRRDDGRAWAGTALTKTMRIRGGMIEQTCGGRASRRALPTGGVTSNWGLLNVLSTAASGGKLSFTVLDELDKVKAGHTLHPATETEIAFGGRRVGVHRRNQIGRGCLPWEYYIDASTGRVLLGLSGLRAYILDDGAAEKTEATFPGFTTAWEDKR